MLEFKRRIDGIPPLDGLSTQATLLSISIQILL